MSRAAAPKARESHPQVPHGVRIVGSQLRSTNLERDTTDGDLQSVHVGVRIRDVLERLASALENMGRTRAWSLTGPYGSGKSTLAALITALLGDDDNRREQALAQVHGAAPRLASRLDTARAAVAPHGMLLAITTARQEPLATTVRRAVHTAVERRWPRSQDVPTRLNAALQRLDSPECTSGDIVGAVAELCAQSPLLLIIDEFGKTLEYLAAQGKSPRAEADLYLLQELAERGAGRSGLPLFLFTLQHLSFADYASSAVSLQTREWAKIQGRFEDVTFTAEIGDTIALLRRCLDHSDLTPKGRTLLTGYDRACRETWDQLGLNGVLVPEPELFADLYPLHPLTAIAAPLLAAQVGQHDRSLTGFLAGDEPNSVTRFIAAHATSRPNRTSTVRLAQLYDYFLASGRTTILASAKASRWIEIDTQLAEAHGLPEHDLVVLKTVALLNLIDSAGALRASERMIMFALHDPTDQADETRSRDLPTTLANLVERGFLIYRDFSDEYRVWRGTDVDLRARIDELWDRADSQTTLQVVSRHLPPAVAAGRHSQRTGMLRYFTTVATDGATDNITGPGADDSADGLLVFHLGDADDVPRIRSCHPVVVGVTKKATTVLDAARYVYALEEILEDDTLDAVARREAAERLSQATAELATRYDQAFTPTLTDSHWLLYRPQADAAGTHMVPDAEPLQGRSLASIVSAACDAVFPKVPHIRNEMLGRKTLTSQGAKARRELLSAMVEHPFEQYLGISGYGPDRAMYSGVLEYLGLHTMLREAATPEHHDQLVSFGFTEPAEDSTLRPAWDALSAALSGADEQTPLTDIYHRLSAPPYGVKDGVIPILVVTALLLRAEDVAVFRQGTYQPRLTTELVELILNSPTIITVKAAPSSKGQRRLVLDELAAHLDVAPARKTRTLRNPLVLTVASALLGHVRTLTPYARRTKRISPQAQAVRAALVSANDPISLIFTDIPVALGFPPVSATAKRDADTAQALTTAVRTALAELDAATPDLRTQAIEAIAAAFRLPAVMPDMRHALAGATRGFLKAKDLDDQLRGLVNIATNTALPDDDWLDPLIVRIAGTALSNWTDADAEGFARQAQQIAGSLDRVSHLYDPSAAAATAPSDGIPVQAQLVTVTTPSGRESRTLVRMPLNAREKAAELAREVLTRAQLELGPDGGRILLAALAEQLLELSDPDAMMEAQQPEPLA